MEISQYWGENVDYYLKNFGIPGHNGLDFAYLNPLGLPAHDSPSYGRPILAPCDLKIKKIIFNGEHSTKGNGIYAVGQGCELIFWHLKAALVAADQDIKKGAIIAEMGNSGLVWPAPAPGDDTDRSGTHLHFALRPLNEDGSIKYPNNDFDGYVDPLPFLNLNPTTNMRYVIDQNKNQWLVDDVFKIAFSIPDEVALMEIKSQGGIQPGQEPEFVNSLVGYLLWRGASDAQFKRFFNL